MFAASRALISTNRITNCAEFIAYVNVHRQQTTNRPTHRRSTLDRMVSAYFQRKRAKSYYIQHKCVAACGTHNSPVGIRMCACMRSRSALSVAKAARQSVVTRSVAVCASDRAIGSYSTTVDGRTVTQTFAQRLILFLRNCTRSHTPIDKHHRAAFPACRRHSGPVMVRTFVCNNIYTHTHTPRAHKRIDHRRMELWNDRLRKATTTYLQFHPCIAGMLTRGGVFQPNDR